MSDVAAADTGVATAQAGNRYTRTAIVFHWVIAALVIANIALAWTFKTWSDYPWTQSVTNTHKTIGITVLGLALMRLLWRIAHRPPPFSPAIPRWQVIGGAHGSCGPVLHHPRHAALRMDLRFGMGICR